MNYENDGTQNILHGSVSCNDRSVFAVFDGMGGEEMGEMAAYIAASKMEDLPADNKPDSALLSFCHTANGAICRYAEDNGIGTMGTTAAIVLPEKKKVYICNIGDSKIFRFSKCKLTQISKDHISLAIGGKKPPLSQNLGIPESELIISPYVADQPYCDGDMYLICSDGLTDMVQTEDIERMLSITARENAAKILLEKALENGGRDNITIILLSVRKVKKSFLATLFGR